METDEMELDTIGDRKTALFVIISDTDDTFNFVVSILYTQLFNLLCDKADDEYGGRLPVHVRCLLDEFANIGQIPKFEKLIATIRSREISASIILQSQSQLKAIYKDNADSRFVVKIEGLRVVGPHVHGLRPGGLVDDVAGDALGFGDYQRPHHAVNGDLAVLVGVIQAVGADVPAGVRYKLSGGGGHFELHPLEGLSVRAPFQDHQRPGLAVLNHNGLGIAALPDHHIGGRAVHHVALWGLDFSYNISTGGKVGNADLSLGVGSEDAVLRQGGRADHAVQAHLTARRRGDTELGPTQRLVGGTVPLLDDQLPLGLVLEGEGIMAVI